MNAPLRHQPFVTLRPKLKRAKPRHIEDDLAIRVANILRTILPRSVMWSHIPLGGKRSAREGARFKAMGTRAGWPDLTFAWVNAGAQNTAFIELKAINGTLSDGQKDFRDWCAQHGFNWALCRSVDEVLETLAAWGVPSRQARAA